MMALGPYQERMLSRSPALSSEARTAEETLGGI